MRVATLCLATALLTLAACQPAPEDGMEEQPSPENIAEVEGTAPGDLARGANRAAQITPSASPASETVALPASNARWFIDGDRAAFGPPESEAVLSIRCTDGSLTVQRVVGRPLDGSLVGNMNFIGNDANTLVRVTNEESELGGSLWQGPVDDAAQMARVIGGGNDAITVDIEGRNAIRVKPSVAAARFVSDCG